MSARKKIQTRNSDADVNIVENYFRNDQVDRIRSKSTNTVLSSEARKDLHCFTVNVSENGLAKLKVKRSILHIQISIETSKIVFLSNENAESYSCSCIDVKLGSKNGLVLKIQTGNTILSKRVQFQSDIERIHFLNVLEQGKRSQGKSKTQELKTPLSSACPFELLAGEKHVQQVDQVGYYVMYSSTEQTVRGRLWITSFRVAFEPYVLENQVARFQIPVAAMDSIVKEGYLLVIECKDIRTIRLAMNMSFIPKHGVSELKRGFSNHVPNAQWLQFIMNTIRPKLEIQQVFAFSYSPAREALGAKMDGWLLYSPVAEFHRLGFIIHSGRKSNPDIRVTLDSFNAHKPGNVAPWRLLKNNNFQFSPTYPQLMVVPSSMTEEQLLQSARFRSKARLPVPAWRHKTRGCVLARSSQPNYGVAAHRCEADRQLVLAYRNAAFHDDLTIRRKFYIIDARKPIATRGNRLKGKGVENSQHYDNSTIEYMGIANIHKMRESIESLKELMAPNCGLDGHKNYHSRLENTRWLKHIMKILNGAIRIARILDDEGHSVLVHCSDGWDRTPQLVASAQLLLDPYYRTIKGFAVLVEKEWCAFGHKFQHRIGLGMEANEYPNERSPVMIQWFDAVWQISSQFPKAFEFNDAMLLFLIDALFSAQFGTFLYNTERERKLHRLWERTESVWTHILLNLSSFTNSKYMPTNRVLYPRANLKKLQVWQDLYSRWDPEYLSDIENFDEETLTNSDSLLADAPQQNNVLDVISEDIDTLDIRTSSTPMEDDRLLSDDSLSSCDEQDKGTSFERKSSNFLLENSKLSLHQSRMQQVSKIKCQRISSQIKIREVADNCKDPELLFMLEEGHRREKELEQLLRFYMAKAAAKIK